MSFTDGMDKTPGRRQHNRGWSRLARQQRREEAVARHNDFIARGRISRRMAEIITPERKLLQEVFGS